MASQLSVSNRHPKSPVLSGRAGFTLIELLVTMAVTLILIFALAQAFALVGAEVAKGRATIEMAGNLRMVANRLQQDLQGITVPVRPPADAGAGGGYVEMVDGASTDKDWNYDGVYDVDPTLNDTTYGDIDDVIAFTTRNAKTPFVGSSYLSPTHPNTLTAKESSLAEIVWWIQFDDLDQSGIRDVGEPFLVYRRAMLIRPDLVALPSRPLSLAASVTNNLPNGPAQYVFGDGLQITVAPNGSVLNEYPDATQLGALQADLNNFFNENDVSVRIAWGVSGGILQLRLNCNSLADLTRRENRYAHMTILSDRPGLSLPAVAAAAPYPTLPAPGFPYRLDTNRRSVTSLYRRTKHGDNLGEDVMLSDALAFDVQVFDPEVPIIGTAAGEALVPSDPGYFPNVGSPPPVDWRTLASRLGNGSFVDIGYGSREAAYLNAAGWTAFSGMPKNKSRLYTPAPGSGPIFDYCTWSNHYERNGFDEDGDGVVDQGTNGFDDPNYVNGVDDVGERETQPPYPVPLRGIQIKIRAIDPDSRQLQQVTVVSDFVPE